MLQGQIQGRWRQVASQMKVAFTAPEEITCKSLRSNPTKGNGADYPADSCWELETENMPPSQSSFQA